jgi:hypothetical protein
MTSEIPEYYCPYHGTMMEWVEDENYPEGGFWDCRECDAEEEAAFAGGGFETDQFGLEYEDDDNENKNG